MIQEHIVSFYNTQYALIRFEPISAAQRGVTVGHGGRRIIITPASYGAGSLAAELPVAGHAIRNIDSSWHGTLQS